MDTKSNREDNPQVLLNGMLAATMNGPFTTGMKPPEMPAAVIGSATFSNTPTRKA